MTNGLGVQDGRLILRLEPDEELPYYRWRTARVLRRVLSQRRSAALRAAIAALRAAIAATRPWSDSLEVADALTAVMPFGIAGLVARRLSELPPGVSDDYAIAVATEAYRAGLDYEPSSPAAVAAEVARELRRFGVPDSTAYRLANERGMTPREATGYAMRRVARMLETDRRMRAGVSRASARRAAARMYP